jgi:1-acyl-sn-glycerol-3-phosphate acyltransferase
MISAAILCGLLYRSRRLQRWFYRAWGHTVLAIVGGRPRRLSGGGDLEPDGSYVFACNHLSLMDIPVLMALLPVDFRLLAKRELLKVPFIGWYLSRGGHLTVDRSSARSGVASMNECARLIRERRLSVAIFPEGTRSPDGRLQPFKDGAAWLAIQAGVPLVPVVIDGTWELLPNKTSCFVPSEIEVRIGAPIAPAGHDLKSRGQLTAEAQERVAVLLGAGHAAATAG